jgi:hypothetical protein
MSIFSKSIAATTDDGYDVNSTWYGSGKPYFGQYEGDDETGGLRFTNITIPQGETINYAIISLYITNGAGDPRLNVYGDDVDDAGAFSSSDLPSNISKTTAVTSFEPETLEAHNIDVTSIVQEIVNRAGWSSGNDIRFGFFNNQGAPGDHEIEISEYGSGSEAEIIISYGIISELEQEGFAFGDDDGSESGHTLGTQDTNVTASLGTKTLRMLIDSTNDPESAGFKLKYQKNGSGGYIDVPVGSSSASGSDDESFESDFGNWEQDPTNDEDWARNSGPTGSSETGPSSAQSGSYYIYVETSSGSAYFNGDESIIINDFGQNKTGTINFYFHQYGTKQGTLYLDQWNGSSWSNIWSSSGDQGDQWNSVTNQAFTSASKLRFRNVAAGGYRGDVALDNIQIDFIATDNEVYVDTSSSVASGGEATTARLTAPSGKTTGDFTIGRRWDDENGSDSIDIGDDKYTELEWILSTQGLATNDYVEFRVYDGDTALDTYTVTPKWTIETTGTNISINIGDSWKTADGMSINIGDSWKTATSVSINIGDTWKTVF